LVQQVTASVFHRFMTSGRTSPILTTCVTHDDEDVDVVVKLNGGMDFGVRGAVFELIGSLMAAKLTIECPRPILVWLSPEFLDAVAVREPDKSQVLKKSAGWNFGSEMLKDAAIWLDGSPIPSTMVSDALNVFIFDGLIQNVDRRHDNPNLMIRGDKLCVIDHECAFSFLSSFVPSSKPWTMGAGDYMERHALRNGLHKKSVDWSTSREILSKLTGDFFDSIYDVLPTEWNGTQDFALIRQHVLTVLEHIDLFETELQRRIA
jgi:hypothetical protein